MLLIHYWNQALCRVSMALGKTLNTLGKEHTVKKLSAKGLCRVSFIGHSAKALLSGPNQKKNLKKIECF
jgi:hypothetical protein